MPELPAEPAAPARIFDGGDLDCGSGLALILREEVGKVGIGMVLELRSREPTVGDDLPPWCRLTGHEFLGSRPGDGYARYFIRRGSPAGTGPEDDAGALERDKQRARDYEWRLRVRAIAPLRSKVYARNFSFEVGQPASFEEKDAAPSAVEYLLGALGGDLAAGFGHECARAGLEVDDIEITLRGKLENIFAHLGLEEGNPGLRGGEVVCFASTFAPEDAVRAAWERTLKRSPLWATLSATAALSARLALL